MSPWVITRKGDRIWSGPPPGTPGQIYLLCFDEPRRLKGVDFNPRYSVSHYVGITWRPEPRKRLYEHGRGVAAALVEWRQGDEAEEHRIKVQDRCPRCGRALDYQAEVTAQRALVRRQHRRTSDRQAVLRAAQVQAVLARSQIRLRQARRTSTRGHVLQGQRRRAQLVQMGNRERLIAELEATRRGISCLDAGR